MSLFDVLTLFGGLAMFLYGMRLMGDALKTGASGTLKVAMEHVTNNSLKAFLLGTVMTAIIQSSTATIVITSGLVGAGILSLHQSLGIIIGANVGTTITGQIIRLLDLDASGGASWLRIFQPSSLAPVALIIGIILIMSGGKSKNSETVGRIAIGFGILFSGLLNMTNAVDTLAKSGVIEKLFTGLNNPILGYAAGAGVAFALQSSSATIGILQALSASGLLTFRSIYAIIVGVYLGDCVTTAIVCSIGAKVDAKRVGIINILFNLGKSVLILVIVTLIHRLGLLDSLWDTTVNSGIIANTNTIFNLVCAIALFPLISLFEKMSMRIVKGRAVSESKYKAKLEALNPVFFNTPALALRSCYDLLLTMLRASRENIRKSIGLLEHFDQEVFDEIQEEEVQIDRGTDHVSQYMVELLPYLREQYHISILDQYYKVTSEFERLGDHAVNISKNAQQLTEKGTTYSQEAIEELHVIEDLLDEILDHTDLAFAKRNVDAAYRIEPLSQLADEVIDVLKKHHLIRMSHGRCNIYADASFTNLMQDLTRIAQVCSNVGVATVVRVRPEIASHEHTYYRGLHAGNDEAYNEQYDRARIKYFRRLDTLEETENSGQGSEASYEK